MVLLLTTIHIKQPVELSVFPSLLLLLTLVRLSLNVASTRLILDERRRCGSRWQRHHMFGQFVVGGNFVVGIVVFLVLIAIQFSPSSTTVLFASRGHARFTLDAMPGRQMAIDVRTSTPASSTRRKPEAAVDRCAVQRDFYGAGWTVRFASRSATHWPRSLITGRSTLSPAPSSASFSTTSMSVNRRFQTPHHPDGW